MKMARNSDPRNLSRELTATAATAGLAQKKNGTITVECTNKLNKRENNNGDCKRDLCECGKAFADNFASNFAAFNSENWKLVENGIYDDKCEKPVPSASRLVSGPSDECCGEYPARKPFLSINNQCA